MNKPKKQSLDLAVTLLKQGRPLAFVKSISGVTLAEMKRQKLIFEIAIPDPKGWSGGDPETGEGATHNGQILRTGKYQSSFSPPKEAVSKSNKEMKRKNRKVFFKHLRQERKRRWAAI